MRGRGEEQGYALLLVIFLVLSMLLVSAVAAPSILTQGKREREKEAVWRGNQYVRAIRLYYQKNGRYPQTLEDLQKASSTGVHYLRKNYKDPTNQKDGKWRLIYVSPTGQLIGSVNYHTLQEMAAKLGLPTQAGQAGSVAPTGSQGAVGGQIASTIGSLMGNTQAGAAGNTGGAGAPGQPAAGQDQQTGQPGQGANGQTGQAGQAGASGFGSGFGSGSTFQPAAALAPVDGPVLGGSVIGVGGANKRDSVIVYQQASNYSKWEFIFNPLTVTSGAGQPPTGTAAPANPNSFGATPGAGAGFGPGGPGAGIQGQGGGNQAPGGGMQNNQPTN